MSEHYLLPQELALVLGMLFGPPFLVGIVIQVAFWARSIPRQRLRRLIGVMATLGAVGSIASFALLALSPQSLPMLGVQDLLYNPFWLPVFPGAFVVFVFGAFVSLHWLRGASP